MNFGRRHEREQIEEQVPVAPDYVEAHCAEFNEGLEFLRRPVAAVDHIGHVGREHKRRSVALDRAHHLRVAEEFAKVNVEQVACRCDHYVVVVPIANAQNVGGHRVACARVQKVIQRSLLLQL